jgi:hypothetical protein
MLMQMRVVTLTTDFGTVDGYVGAMKGVILSAAPGAVVVDLTHDIPRHDVNAGAFALAQAARYFPTGTIHVAVVDPGVGGERLDLVVEVHGQTFIGPDNGLLSLATRGPRAAHRIANAAFQRVPVSPTFHGRDVFAAAAGRIAAGALARDAGPVVPAILDLADNARRADGPGEAGVVVHVDVFGNLITSFEGRMLTPGTWTFEGPDLTAPLRVPAGRTYADVAPGELVTYAGSAGLVEIAVREGSAGARTGLRRGASLRATEPPA